MALKIYKISEYEHTAEIRQFDALCHILNERVGTVTSSDTVSLDDAILIGNYNIEGVELDALLFTPQAVTVIEFKNWGGSIVAGENGPWTSNGRTIAGGAYGKSPFVQARLNRSRVQAGLQRYLGIEAIEVSVVVVFAQPSSIDVTGLSPVVRRWLTVCDNSHLSEVILSQRAPHPLFTPAQMHHIPQLLRIESFDLSHFKAQIPGSLDEQNFAADLYDQLIQMPELLDIRIRYRQLAEIFRLAVDGKLQNSKTKFSGFFAKVDYLLTENRHKMPDVSLAASVNAFRIRARRVRPLRRIISDSATTTSDKNPNTISDEELQQSVVHDTAALSRFISLLYDVPVPAVLDKRFPYIISQYHRPLYHHGDVMRVVINSWDDAYINATDSATGDACRIYYRKEDNPYALSDRSYLSDILLKGEQLNLILPRIEDGIIYPAIIIFNPDFLIDVTSLAGCFSEQETATPYAYMLKKLAPAVSGEAIMLGNFAGQLLDEEVHHIHRTYEQSLAEFCARNAINLAVTPLSPHFRTKAELQRQHIRQALSEALTEASAVSFQRDGSHTILEPSFFCETLGLQARMDFIQKDMTLMVEQKSGQASSKSSLESPRVRPDHYVQALLYRAIFRYNYGVPYKDFHSYMLYSRYPNSLIDIASVSQVMVKAHFLHNQVAWL